DGVGLTVRKKHRPNNVFSRTRNSASRTARIRIDKHWLPGQHRRVTQPGCQTIHLVAHVSARGVESVLNGVHDHRVIAGHRVAEPRKATLWYRGAGMRNVCGVD